MLQQLARLSVEAEGRFATDEELQFLKDYLQSVEQRVIAYEKIHEAEEKIIHLVEAKKRAHNANLFQLNSGDVTQVCRRDLRNVLRHSAAALLFDERERLQESLLLWYQTIVRAYKYESYAKVTYQILQEAIKQYLLPEEATLFYPFLQLNQLVLSS